MPACSVPKATNAQKPIKRPTESAARDGERGGKPAALLAYTRLAGNAGVAMTLRSPLRTGSAVMLVVSSSLIFTSEGCPGCCACMAALSASIL